MSIKRTRSLLIMVISIVSRALSRSVFYLSIWTVVSLYFLNTNLDKIRLVFHPPEYSTLHAKATTIAVFDGPGENGAPYYLRDNVSQEIRQLIAKGWARNGFNQYVSDLISVHRSLPDFRHEWCKARDRFLPERLLPTTSIIICFHDEAWSTLLRTVHSVLERSPPALVKEIILVDDFSQLPHCQLQLQEYMAQHAKVRIVRTTKRQGLIRARLVGVRHAKAPVLTFLDAHCEVTAGWLEPLLDRIARNPRTVVCPTVDIIDQATLEYKNTRLNDYKLGGFNWSLGFNWIPIPHREKKRRIHPAAPLYSPAMVGGLFSIHKAFFEYLGTYDPEFEIWGGEHLELSFKIWMCGGTLEYLPCSHVGHIFSGYRPLKFRPSSEGLKRNNVRLAQVWMDQYAAIYFRRIGYKLGEFGDISSRLELRKKLGCKSFHWYLSNVYRDRMISPNLVASGTISSKWSPACIMTLVSKLLKPVVVSNCKELKGYHSSWKMIRSGHIGSQYGCLYASNHTAQLSMCRSRKINLLWKYDDKTGLIRSQKSGLCLSMYDSTSQLMLFECDESKRNQQWRFSNYYPWNDGNSFVHLVHKFLVEHTSEAFKVQK